MEKDYEVDGQILINEIRFRADGSPCGVGNARVVDREEAERLVLAGEARINGCKQGEIPWSSPPVAEAEEKDE